MRCLPASSSSLLKNSFGMLDMTSAAKSRD
jgi:hypothetical protein